MKVFVAGGAGFIGSHIVRHLLAEPDNQVTVFDNFSSGQRWHFGSAINDPRLRIVEGDLKDLPAILDAIQGAERVYHFASNPDIAKAMRQPDVDFWEGTYLTQNLLEAIRLANVPELIYASGSGVYGDTGETPVTEDHTPMLPISPYGASKLSCEVTIHAYTHMFALKASVFRFANVVGGQQTHGVAYDFIRKLRSDRDNLSILGDGTQTKAYVHVSDVVAGIQYFVGRRQNKFDYFHLATTDYLTVNEIADLVGEEMNLSPARHYSGGKRGWSGDVPVVRFDLTKVHSRGWRARLTAREAMREAIRAMLAETD